MSPQTGGCSSWSPPPSPADWLWMGSLPALVSPAWLLYLVSREHTRVAALLPAEAQLERCQCRVLLFLASHRWLFPQLALFQPLPPTLVKSLGLLLPTTGLSSPPLLS